MLIIESQFTAGVVIPFVLWAKGLQNYRLKLKTDNLTIKMDNFMLSL